jgi:hypothetical protein
MANLHTILPLLESDSWQWDKSELIDERVPAGRSKSVFDSSSTPGFLYYGLVIVQGTNGEKTELDIQLDNFQLRQTIEGAYTVGSTQKGAVSPGIARYDTENDIYSVVYEPSPPLAYISNAKIDVVAPSNDDIRVESDALRLDITDVNGFRRSYQEATISQMLDGLSQVERQFEQMNNNIEDLVEEIRNLRRNRV